MMSSRMIGAHCLVNNSIIITDAFLSYLRRSAPICANMI
jgi:hypothetical protein